MDADKLSACHFCASKKLEMLDVSAEYGDGYKVHCTNCRAEGPLSGNETMAILRWNKEIT